MFRTERERFFLTEKGDFSTNSTSSLGGLLQQTPEGVVRTNDWKNWWTPTIEPLYILMLSENVNVLPEKKWAVLVERRCREGAGKILFFSPRFVREKVFWERGPPPKYFLGETQLECGPSVGFPKKAKMSISQAINCQVGRLTFLKCRKDPFVPWIGPPIGHIPSRLLRRPPFEIPDPCVLKGPLMRFYVHREAGYLGVKF